MFLEFQLKISRTGTSLNATPTDGKICPRQLDVCQDFLAFNNVIVLDVVTKTVLYTEFLRTVLSTCCLHFRVKNSAEIDFPLTHNPLTWKIW